MNDEDREFLYSQPDGRIVMSTPRLYIRELKRKNARVLIDVTASLGRSSMFFRDETLAGLFSENEPDEAIEERAGALIAGDITDQYRFFGYGLWGIFLKEECIPDSASGTISRHVPAGLVGLKNGSASGIGEICYFVHPDLRRKGLAFEACLAVVRYAASCGFSSLEACVDPLNTPSSSLIKKLNETGDLHINIINDPSRS